MPVGGVRVKTRRRGTVVDGAAAAAAAAASPPRRTGARLGRVLAPQVPLGFLPDLFVLPHCEFTGRRDGGRGGGRCRERGRERRG